MYVIISCYLEADDKLTFQVMEMRVFKKENLFFKFMTQARCNDNSL
jgi:hypothetical protein